MMIQIQHKHIKKRKGAIEIYEAKTEKGIQIKVEYENKSGPFSCVPVHVLMEKKFLEAAKEHGLHEEDFQWPNKQDN